MRRDENEEKLINVVESNDRVVIGVTGWSCPPLSAGRGACSKRHSP